MFPDQHGEPVYVVGEQERDEWGEVLGNKILKTIPNCIVSPAGDYVVQGESYTHGDITKYQVLAPAGTKLGDGDIVQIRGEIFQVDPLQSFDYSIGRRPALRRHRPKVIFTVSRGEVGDGISG